MHKIPTLVVISTVQQSLFRFGHCRLFVVTVQNNYIFFINDRKECKHNRNRIRTVFIVSCFRIVVRVLAMIRLGLSFFSLLRSMSACVFLLLSSSSLGIMCIEEIGKICVRTTVEWREQKKNKPDTYMTPIVWSVLRRILNISKFWCWSNVQTFKAFCHAYRKNVPYKMTFFIVWRLIFSSLYFWSCHGFFCIFFFSLLSLFSDPNLDRVFLLIVKAILMNASSIDIHCWNLY